MRTMIVLVGLVMGACGGGDEAAAAEETSGGEAIVGSCNAITQIGLCEEYRGPIPADALAQRQARCTQIGGAYSATPCPTAGILGSCTAVAPQAAGGIPGTSVYGAAYTEPAIPTGQAQCTQNGGAWVAAQ
jgi:hypothetical protein